MRLHRSPSPPWGLPPSPGLSKELNVSRFLSVIQQVRVEELLVPRTTLAKKWNKRQEKQDLQMALYPLINPQHIFTASQPSHWRQIWHAIQSPVPLSPTRSRRLQSVWRQAAKTRSTGRVSFVKKLTISQNSYLGRSLTLSKHARYSIPSSSFPPHLPFPNPTLTVWRSKASGYRKVNEDIKYKEFSK